MLGGCAATIVAGSEATVVVISDSTCRVPVGSSMAAGNVTLYVLGRRLPDRVVVIDSLMSAFGSGKRWTLRVQSAVAVWLVLLQPRLTGRSGSLVAAPFVDGFSSVMAIMTLGVGGGRVSAFRVSRAATGDAGVLAGVLGGGGVFAGVGLLVGVLVGLHVGVGVLVSVLIGVLVGVGALALLSKQ